MKTFELPVSDCGWFVAGDLTDFPQPNPQPGEEPPKYGVIVWYKDKEAIRVACAAATNAHW